MLSWKRTLSIGLILIMLASAVFVFSGAEAEPTRASNPTLTSASVYPSIGYNDTLFNFTVWYSDAENDTPVWVKVVIDNVWYNMTENRGGTSNYTGGAQFFYTTYLTAGAHTYYYLTQNVLREGARDPQNNTYAITVQSRSTTPQLYNGGHSPSRPTNATGVNFTVMYRHPNGTAPMFVNLFVHSVYTKVNTTYNMTLSGSNYTAGVTYTKFLQLSSGYYYFKFNAFIPPNQTLNLPSSGMTLLYVVPAGPQNSNPVLSGVGHNPRNPSSGQNTSFWVTYTDDNGDSPTGVWLHYYSQNDYYNQTTVNMTVGSGNVTTGVNCSALITAPVYNGTYYYYIKTWDVHGAPATTSTYHFLVGTPPPQTPYLTYGRHAPQHPTVNDTINFTVNYIDPRGATLPDNVYLTIKPINGSMVNYTMAPSHTNASRHITYYYNLNLANNTYSYYFRVVIGTYSHKYPSGHLWMIVRAQNPPPANPYLSRGSHAPPHPTTNDTINFTVVYTDPLGTRVPDYVQVYLTNLDVEVLVPTVYNMVRGTGDPRNGTVYYYTVSLMAGNYSYYYHAIVGNYSTSYPSGFSLSLFVRNGSTPPPVDNAPVLSSGGHSPARPTSGSNVTFTVTYTDRDGDAPRFIKLHINPIVSSRPYSVYNMSWTGSSYVYGVRAQYVLSLTTGNYSYYFTTSSTNWTVTHSQGGLGFNLTVVSGSTPPPQQNRAPTLTSPGMTPSSPVANRTIYFSIIYTDADNDAPYNVKFHLWGGRNSNYVNYSMSVPRGTYSNGVTCTYSIVLTAGTYYYFYSASSINHTVVYPSSGVMSFNVTSGTTPPPYNKTNIGARTTIIYDDGAVTMDVTEKEEGFTISLGASGDDFIEIDVSSQSGEDRVIELTLDPEMFDIDSPDDLVVKVDGKEISHTYVADPDEWTGDEPAYYIRYTETGAVLYVLLPDADNHTITAKIPDGSEKGNDDFWYYLIAILVIIVIAAAIAISLLTASQKKRIREYYDDFDTGVRDEKISSGKLINEDDIDWDDLIEAE